MSPGKAEGNPFALWKSFQDHAFAGYFAQEFHNVCWKKMPQTMVSLADEYILIQLAIAGYAVGFYPVIRSHQHLRGVEL